MIEYWETEKIQRKKLTKIPKEGDAERSKKKKNKNKERQEKESIYLSIGLVYFLFYLHIYLCGIFNAKAILVEE